MTRFQAENRVLQHHRQLTVWDKAIDLAAAVYRVSRMLPASERFGLSQQMRSAATSIAANIAEGKEHSSARLRTLYRNCARVGS